MIQRIQTLYLIVAALVSGGLINVIYLWKENDSLVYILDLFESTSLLLKSIPALFLVSAVLSLIAIFLFKNRKLQFVINRLNILTNLFLLGVLLYYLLSLPGETVVSEKGIGVFIPIVVVLLLVLANKAIHKDENLVKSVDRLR
jgi:hypothetical protein